MPLHPSFPSSSSLPLSLLHLNPPHYSLIPLHPLPHYLSPSFLSVILTTSLPPSSQSSSLPLSFLPLNPPHYFSPSFLSILLTTSLPPSSQSSSPPLHPSFLSIRHLITSSLSCNIIIHLITSVFLPSPSSLLTLPNYLLRRHHHPPYYLLLTTSLLLVYLYHFVLSILFLQISSSIPVSLLPHHYPPHYLHPFPY